ncbi:MAG: HAD-IA family hydrolase [Catonella sp.]|nr:HAD-IA family hydrolase [Catonella sp.]MDY6357678.1 HAD-IA family hydrolase [Catonella sp.]
MEEIYNDYEAKSLSPLAVIFDINGGLTMIPFVKEYAMTLKKDGMKLAAVSSSTKKEMDADLKKAGIDFFDVKISGENMPPKPAPDMLRQAAKALYVPVFNIVAIEDTEVGVQAALNAGMVPVGYRSPFSPGEKLGKADRIMNTFENAKARSIRLAFAHGRYLPMQ